MSLCDVKLKSYNILKHQYATLRFKVSKVLLT